MLRSCSAPQSPWVQGKAPFGSIIPCMIRRSHLSQNEAAIYGEASVGFLEVLNGKQSAYDPRISFLRQTTVAGDQIHAAAFPRYAYKPNLLRTSRCLDLRLGYPLVPNVTLTADARIGPRTPTETHWSRASNASLQKSLVIQIRVKICPSRK